MNVFHRRTKSRCLFTLLLSESACFFIILTDFISLEWAVKIMLPETLASRVSGGESEADKDGKSSADIKIAMRSLISYVLNLKNEVKLKLSQAVVEAARSRN